MFAVKYAGGLLHYNEQLDIRARRHIKSSVHTKVRCYTGLIQTLPHACYMVNGVRAIEVAFSLYITRPLSVRPPRSNLITFKPHHI